MSEESITPPTTINNSFSPKQIGKYTISTLKLNENCLKQDSKTN